MTTEDVSAAGRGYERMRFITDRGRLALEHDHAERSLPRPADDLVSAAPPRKDALAMGRFQH
jgi:hypothetical protein